MHLIHPEHPPANPGSLDPASPPSKTSGGLLSERRLVYFLSGAPNERRAPNGQSYGYDNFDGGAMFLDCQHEKSLRYT
jgi:hypothetical protein